MKRVVLCDYCQKPAKLVDGIIIYPHRPDLRDKKIWACDPCAAYVGCHSGSVTPLGRLANADLRKAKMQAHQFFDRLWRSGKISRHEAYSWLAQKLNIPKRDCHIGMMDVAACNIVAEVSQEYCIQLGIGPNRDPHSDHSTTR